MKKTRAENTILDFFKLIRQHKRGHELVQCFHYLTSIRLKHKFARSRLTALKRKKSYYMKTRVEEYSNEALKTTWPDNYSILMDFDHCVICIRSLIEHLLQLINLVIPLGLSPQRRGKIKAVDIDTIISVMNECELCQNNVVLKELMRNIQELKTQPWYDHLHKLRIEQYHNKFTTPSLNEHRSKDRELRDISWMISGVKRENWVGGNHIDIIEYCEDRIQNIEDILLKNLVLLRRYLQNK